MALGCRLRSPFAYLGGDLYGEIKRICARTNACTSVPGNMSLVEHAVSLIRLIFYSRSAIFCVSFGIEIPNSV